ncbi:hypothetical protein [Haloplanus salilacus]|uniref:hypothetical protein n=1 Tax=Haloplanus salilacus TaxID=2949994 RepID=UPI0030CB95AB
MSLLGKLLSLFGGGSSADTAETEPEPEPEATEAPESEADADAEDAESEDEEADDDSMHSGELAAAADPRRDPSEDDTVADRAANPDDHAA